MKPAFVQQCNHYAPINVTRLVIEDEYGCIELPNTEEAIRGVYHEVTVKDEYQFKHTKQMHPDINVAVDLGASWGVATRMMRWLWPKATVVALEPYLPRFEMLKINSPSSTNYCMAVVGSESCRNTVTSVGDPVALDVFETCKASEFFNYNIDLLKIDIEGYEGEVLRDLFTVSLPKVVTGEWHYDSNKKELARLFDHYGYKVQWSNTSKNPWDTFFACM